MAADNAKFGPQDVPIVDLDANHIVGNLPNGYIRSVPLPRIPVPWDWGFPTGRVQTAC